MQKLHLQIVTPERLVFEDEIDTLSVMTEMGEITILPNHIPLVANLRAGEMRLQKDGEEHVLASSTGFIEVRPGNTIIILADSAERMEELDLEKIEIAKEQARKAMEEKREVDDVAFAHAAAALERELARYKVAMKRKHGRKN